MYSCLEIGQTTVAPVLIFHIMHNTYLATQNANDEHFISITMMIFEYIFDTGKHDKNYTLLYVPPPIPPSMNH